MQGSDTDAVHRLYGPHLWVIAHVIAELADEAERRRIAEHFADRLAANNRYFRRDLFLRAAMGEVH